MEKGFKEIINNLKVIVTQWTGKNDNDDKKGAEILVQKVMKGHQIQQKIKTIVINEIGQGTK